MLIIYNEIRCQRKKIHSGKVDPPLNTVCHAYPYGQTKSKISKMQQLETLTEFHLANNTMQWEES